MAKHLAYRTNYIRVLTVLMMFALFSLGNVFGQEQETAGTPVNFEGYILQEDAPMEFATVIIEELQMDTLTDEQGYFSFGDVPSGTYTLLVISDVLGEKEFSVTINEDIQELTFQMSDTEV